MKVTVTKTEISLFAAVTTVPMSDGSFQSDCWMKLDGNVLRSLERSSYIRTGGLLRFNLGPVSLAKVSALEVGQSVELS